MTAVLKMILIGKHKRIAVINDDFLYEGSEFEGRRVRRILKKSVILSGSSGDVQLQLGQLSLAQMAERKKEQPEKEPALGRDDPGARRRTVGRAFRSFERRTGSGHETDGTPGPGHVIPIEIGISLGIRLICLMDCCGSG